MNKIKFFTVILLVFFLSSNTYSDDNTKTWKKICSEENSESCFIRILYKVKLPDQDDKQTFATASIQIGSTKEKIMSLIDEKDQTYKLGEANKPVTVLFINLPLNTDLRKSPLITSDKISLGNPKFLNCNKSIGCRTMAIIDEKIIEVFKKGKSLSITFAAFGINENITIQFPLKGFTKAYEKLAKR